MLGLRVYHVRRLEEAARVEERMSITREEFNSMNEDLWVRALAPVQKVRATVRS